MPNVLNPEPESITLNTELETPTLDPATELDAPSSESTSNPETAEVHTAVEPPALDADASTEPVAQAAPAQHEPTQAAAPVASAPPEHSPDSADDFSAALEAFEREQAAEAAAVEAYGDKVVSGTVLKQTEKHLVVDVGLKSEGLVPIEQVIDHTGAVKLQPGDPIEVVIEREEPEGGYLVSYEKAQRLRVWDTIEKAANEKTPVMGTIVSRVKGGLTVDIGMKAFLPGSQLEIRPVRNLDGYLGQQIEVRVIKLNKKRGNVVVSRKEILEEEQNSKRSHTLEQLGEGAVLTGTVKNLTDYGAFVDLGGIDGLLHITDMAWKRVKHPSEVVKVGDEIEVRILKFDRERSRVSLGLKQLGADPWQNISRRYPPGTRVFGKVTNIADYGAFVEIEDGVEGLVHVSEMDWTNKNVNPAKVVHTGQEVEVMVLDVDEERRRVSLGLKQCQANPWKEFAENYNRGDKVTGQIKSITDFGIFIGLPGNIDGLVHLSDISWDQPGEEAVRNYQKGQQIEAMVLSIDPERERISLGIKQLAKDPFSAYIADNPKGTIVRGVVKEVDARGAIIDLGNGIEGQLRASELGRDRVEDARAVLKVGDSVEAKFTGGDRKSRTISLSIKAKEAHEEAEAVQSYRSETATSGTSLGDLLKEHIGSGESH